MLRWQLTCSAYDIRVAVARGNRTDARENIDTNYAICLSSSNAYSCSPGLLPHKTIFFHIVSSELTITSTLLFVFLINNAASL